MKTHSGLVNSIELPELWQPALEGVDPCLAERLVRTWQLASTDPLQAANEAELLFLEVRDQKTLAPWLLFVLAISNRIHTLSSFASLDELLDFFGASRQSLLAPPELCLQIDICYFAGLVFRRPGHPDIGRWADSCLQAFEAEGPVSIRLSAANFLLLYRIWCGDLLGADVLRQRMMPLRRRTDDVRLQLFCHTTSAMSLRLFVDYASCSEEIAQGLALAQRTGIHSWDSHLYMQAAALALCRENLREADEWLALMEPASPPEHYLDRSGYHYMRAWLHMLTSDDALALSHAQESVRLAEYSGALCPLAVTRVALAQVYIDRRQLTQAFYQISRVRHLVRSLPAQRALPFARKLTYAHVCFKVGMVERGKVALREAFSMGREQRYLNFPWWRSHYMAGLCAQALQAGVEPDYTRWLIRQRRLQPPADFTQLDSWYWPLHIDVLGSPRILLDGESIDIGAKASELLFTLASLADAEGWVSRSRLADLLWPGSDGDRAQQALDTAIHRLRRQLDTEAMILTRPGAVGLNAGLVRVDYRRLLQALAEPDGGSEQARHLIEAAGKLATMPPEGTHLLPVGRLQRQIALKLLELLDGPLRGAAEAEQWLEELLTMMPEVERLWQAIIRLHLQQGLPSAALEAWRRCETALAAIDVAPSPATRALVQPWLKPRILREYSA